MADAFDILALHAAQAPDKVALISESGRTLTYDQLNRRANRAADAFSRLGIRAGDRVLHIHHNRLEAFELGQGLRKLRAVSTPMNWRLRPAEMAYLLNDSGASCMVASAEFADAVDEARPLVDDAGSRRWILFDDARRDGWLNWEPLLAEADESEPPTPASPTGPTMVYTAGTTGRPKGAYRPKGIDVEAIFMWIANLGLRGDDVHLLAGPGYHSAPAAFSGLQQILGATCVVMERFDPLRAIELIEQHHVTTTFMAPILVRRILDLPADVRAGHDVSSMRVLIVAAAPFPGDLKRRAVEYFGHSVFEFYGASETGLVTLIGPDDLLRKPDSCGRVLPGVEVRLLDDEGNEVPDGTPGELWARSSGILTEYYNNPEATRRNLRDGFFTVGDIAYRDGEGYIHICDRKVDMIISGGVNIYPAEIEAALAEHPAVQDVAVIGVPDDEWGERVIAIVQRRDGASLDADELDVHCRTRLADYKRPRAFEFVEDFPRDLAGKTLKRVLREPYWAQAGRRI
jgi:acyl-CoA synthetase (AMP-forming)/AMP-acid ligase II